MLLEKLGMDEKDLRIVSWFMEDPYISQNEIANRLHLSQPSINIRVNRLKREGVLNHNVGINLNKSGLFLVRVDFTAENASRVLDRLGSCSFFVNGFVMSGKHNASMFLVNEDLKKIDAILNQHLRSDKSVSDINVNVVVSSTNDFIFKINLDKEMYHEKCLEKDCEYCELKKDL